MPFSTFQRVFDGSGCLYPRQPFKELPSNRFVQPSCTTGSFAAGETVITAAIAAARPTYATRTFMLAPLRQVFVNFQIPMSNSQRPGARHWGLGVGFWELREVGMGES